jgi:hypothetical protein
MTYTVTIVTGRPKNDLIEMAYEFCGSAGYEFERTAEEVSSALRQLDTMMTGWPFDQMGYDPATYGSGLPEDPSGLAEKDVPVVFMHLAELIAPGMGASLPAQALAAKKRAWASACSRYADTPTMPRAEKTPAGMGNRPYARFAPFLPRGC